MRHSASTAHPVRQPPFGRSSGRGRVGRQGTNCCNEWRRTHAALYHNDSMTIAPNGSRLIFTTIQHRHSPEGFHARRTRRLECLCTTAGYNDVSGFAEVYWDAAARILVKATDYNARSISIHSRIVRSCRSAAARYGRSSDRYRSSRVVRLSGAARARNFTSSRSRPEFLSSFESARS
jgi:hypothetical protein